MASDDLMETPALPCEPLEYGCATHYPASRIFKRLALAIVLGGVALASLYFGYWKFYYMDRDRIQAELKAVAKGHAFRVEGYDDNPFFLKLADAWVNVDSVGTKCIHFNPTEPGELKNGTRMVIKSIDRYGLWIERDDDLWYAQSLDVSQKSEFAADFPWKFQNVGDVVAHYDDIVAYIAREPTGTSVDAHGKKHHYRIRAK